MKAMMKTKKLMTTRRKIRNEVEKFAGFFSLVDEIDEID